MPFAALDLPASTPRNLHEIESEITELAAHIHAATYRLLELVREFDEREGWGGPGLKSCAHWLIGNGNRPAPRARKSGWRMRSRSCRNQQCVPAWNSQLSPRSAP